MAEEEQVLTLAHETGPPTTRTRKRDSSLCVGLPDTHKAAHKNRCAVEMRKQVFAVGNAVQARWGGAKGKAWYAGTVTGVSELSAEQGGPAWTYDIQYNDGDLRRVLWRSMCVRSAVWSARTARYELGRQANLSLPDLASRI